MTWLRKYPPPHITNVYQQGKEKKKRLSSMSFADQVKMFQVCWVFPLKMDSELIDHYLFLHCFGTLSNIKCTFVFSRKYISKLCNYFLYSC